MKLACRCALVALLFAQGGHAFRRKKVEKTSLRRQEPKALLEELEQVLGAEHREAAEQRLHEFEDDLRITFKALPKNGRGAVAAPSARYALHRLFNQRHGWQIKGLETAAGAWDADSPVTAMGDRVPPKMRELFEDRLGSYGMTLHELAILAATMDKMFETDVAERLRIVYKASALKTEAHINYNQAKNVLWTYVAAFITGPQVESLTEGEVHKALDHFETRFPRHAEARDLLAAIADEVGGRRSNSYDFATLQTILSKFGQRLGALEDTECKVMKNRLTSLEHREGSGLVRLGDFYGNDKFDFHFTESPVYLRGAGLLDESNPNDPKVIIPNYLAGPSNCVQPSGYYSICCFDECEQLMDKVEEGLEAPMGTPEKIMDLVSGLPSSSLPANRTLSPHLKTLLDEVAGHHGGMVPIHGRLFAQWMHEAYPRECSYPHLEVKVQSRFDHSTEMDHVEAAEKSKYWQIAKQLEGSGENQTTSRWIMKEELVDRQGFEAHVKSSTRDDLTIFGALGFVGMAVVRHIAPALRPPAAVDSQTRMCISRPSSVQVFVLKLDETVSDDIAIVGTLDFFTPIVDEPEVFGGIAAANALSDVYAMGARPIFALNIVGFPSNRLPPSVLARILKGGQEKCAEAGVAILGGHTVEDLEPKYGLAVIGPSEPSGALKSIEMHLCPPTCELA
ncbi:selD [Symbiodinium natans]|uniref:SelD protein n=1 Tax=Symbiodinium natans TaxID=878477 RepID=A0A812KES5_9DINO|nr:selD [Symbiodinium natans]